MGEAARQVVSGLYSLSQVVSWQVVSPLLSAAVPGKGGQGVDEHRGVSEGRGEEPDVVGGGVLVMDLGPTLTGMPQEEEGQSTRHRGGGGDSDSVDVDVDVDVAVRAHFAAHSAALGSMAFSPSGLKLASADCFGQVVLVHSLVPSGMLSRAHPVISPASMQYDEGGSGVESEYMATLSAPQLLFKLVRGLSLSIIVDIGFTANESVVFGSTANGTVHVFDLDQLSATDSSQGHSHGSSLASHSSFKSGNSLTNGGYGSLEHTSVLLSPPSSSHTSGTGTGTGAGGGSMGTHASSSASALLTMAAGTVSEGAFHQYGIPSADVTQFLSLRRPDLRVLQGYSDIRVKLPLSETYYRQQQQQQQNGNAESKGGHSGINGHVPVQEDLRGDPSRSHDNGHGSDSSGGSGGSPSYYPQEVNLHSSSLLYGGGGQSVESRGSYELLVGTSEGLLSRYHLTLSANTAAVTASQHSGGGGIASGVPAVLSNLLPYSHNQSVKELNRWDLCVSTAGDSGNTSQNQNLNQSPLPHQSQAESQNQSQSRGPGAQKSGEGDYSAWLYAASDVDEPLVSPLWIRPQVKLFTFQSGDTEGAGEGKGDGSR
mgnify:CR=1 FL=1